MGRAEVALPVTHSAMTEQVTSRPRPMAKRRAERSQLLWSTQENADMLCASARERAGKGDEDR